MNQTAAVSRRRRAGGASTNRSRRRAFAAAIEAMEPRIVLSTFHWKAAVDGDFNAAASWQENAVPGPNDDAIIAFSGITATSSAARSINSLTSNARLNVTA